MDPSTAMNGHDGGVEWTFQNPWPFDEDNFLVSYSKSKNNFKIYFMNADASRELIAWDANGRSRRLPICRPTIRRKQLF